MTDTAASSAPLSSGPLWKSLRLRLALWNGAVALLVAALALVGLRQGLSWALLREVDQVLVHDAEEISLALSDLRSDELAALKEELVRKAIGHRRRGWYVKLCDDQDRVLWASPGASPRTAQYDPKRPEMPWTHDGFRVVRRRAPANDHGIGVLRVGTTLASIHEDLALMDRWAIGAAGAVLAFAPLCGYWLAGRAARTVGDITDTASRMRPAHLNERLPLSGAGDELDQLAETINGMLDRIASHLERRRDFLANAAHELRTPLAAIRSSIEVALGQERSPEAYRDLLADVLDEAGSLETLVNQLLLISESEADVRQSDLQPTPLHELVAKAVDMFRGVAESRDIQLIIQRRDETMVPGRRAHLRQVVNNLLDNAIKYTPSGGRVTVALAADPEQRMARLSISDNGPGIDASDQGAIFDRFFRTDRARSRDETRGAGLGLSICRSVVEAHQGAIRCQSTLGAGTTMIVELPLADARARPITQPHREA